jgi:hypothetical protein
LSERRQIEAAAEAERKANKPLAVLRAAHTLQTEAQAEVDRLDPLVARARELVAEIEGRARAQEAEAKAARAAAAEALVEALVAGKALPPPVRPPDRSDLNDAAELATAGAALEKLETELTAARDLLQRRGHGVSRCAVAVLVDQAADLANGIIADQAALDQRRADLDSLATLLTNEGRRLNRQPPSLPPQITRALYSPDRQLTGAANPIAATDWRARYAALIEAPG